MLSAVIACSVLFVLRLAEITITQSIWTERCVLADSWERLPLRKESRRPVNSTHGFSSVTTGVCCSVTASQRTTSPSPQIPSSFYVRRGCSKPVRICCRPTVSAAYRYSCSYEIIISCHVYQQAENISYGIRQSALQRLYRNWKRLRHLDLMRLETRRIKDDLIEVFKIVNGGFSIDPDMCSKYDDGGRRGQS